MTAERATIEGGIPGRDRRLRVALVNAADRGGGAEASTLSLHQALQKLGHESHLYVGTKLTDDENVHQIDRFRCFPGVLRAAGVLERRFGWQYLYHPWFRRLDRLIGRSADVVHLQSLWSGTLGYADVGGLPRLTRLYPTLLTLRDTWMLTGHCACPALGCDRWKTGCGQCPDLTISPAITRDGTRFNWKRKRAAIQKSELRVTTVSDWLAGEVQQSPIFSGKSIHTVHNGIDETHFYPRSRAQMREKHGLPQAAFIVMLAGQSVEGTSRRGGGAVDYALDALSRSGVEPFVLIVGNSSHVVMKLWARSGTVVPFQTDPDSMAELYCAADVVLVASLWETFGRVAAEAQMCGIPVAAFATGGLPEIVIDSQTGLLVEPLKSDALGAAVKTLHGRPELRLQMGELGARNAVRKFSNTAIAATYVDHYSAVIAERLPRVKA